MAMAATGVGEELTESAPLLGPDRMLAPRSLDTSALASGTLGKQSTAIRAVEETS
jgi:hypothetical protein